VAVAVAFDEATRRILDGRNFATVATVNPDGSPHSSVVWMTREGDTILFSSLARRRKVRNLVRDPRISVSVFEVENPYNSVDIRGIAELVEDTAKTMPDVLSRKYLGTDAPPEPDEELRYTVRVIPQKVTNFSV
jgi:PPOX class probable F420-dependent enzyme